MHFFNKRKFSKT